MGKKRGASRRLIVSVLDGTPRIPVSLHDERIDHDLQRFDAAHTVALQHLDRGDPRPYKKFLEALSHKERQR